MLPSDIRTGFSRGYFMLSKGHKECSNTMCKLKSSNWATISGQLTPKLSFLFTEHSPQSVEEIIYLIFQHFPNELSSLITLTGNDKKQQRMKDTIVKTQLHSIVKETLERRNLVNNLPISVEVATLILLAFPSHLYKELPPLLRSEFHTLRNLDTLPIDVSKEILDLRYQMNLSHCTKILS